MFFMHWDCPKGLPMGTLFSIVAWLKWFSQCIEVIGGEDGVETESFAFAARKSDPTGASTVSVEDFTVVPQCSNSLEFC